MGEHAIAPPLTRAELLQFLRRHRLAVQSTAAPSGGVQAAVVGIAVSDDFEIVFDTLESTRKVQNLAGNSHIAVVIGGVLNGEEQTVQYEGIADRPSGAELQQARELYFGTWPDGRDRLQWPGLIHIRVRPAWLRFSDFRSDPPTIVELDASQLRSLR
jgi:uncharacterized protein YhbP (UPF0306 family)